MRGFKMGNWEWDNGKVFQEKGIGALTWGGCMADIVVGGVLPYESEFGRR
jgi:hypothetical protein